MARMRMNQAVTSAIADEMRKNPDVVVFGEDVAVAGGPFKTSDGLLEEFGPLRVRDTPISEMGFLGAAVGAAATGLRPVAEIMFIEFLGVALDQVVTEAAKLCYLSGGEVRVPIVVRASAGAGLGFGCQHSQVLDSWLIGNPGLKLAVTSGPENAYGLMRSAIRDDGPVVVLEPRPLYAVRGDVTTGEEGIIPLGRASLRASGEDATIVALGSTVSSALQAVASAELWSADVIDLQTLQPWDTDAVLASVRRTGRLVTVEEGPLSGGWGAHIASKVVGELFSELLSAPLRITSPDTHVPFAKELEDLYRPGADYIKTQVSALISTGEVPLHWWEAEGAAV